MALRLAALALGTVTGFTFAWARMTDPNTFHRMLSLDSLRIYLLMGAAVAVAFAGTRLIRGRRTLLTREPIGWTTTRPTRSHIVGSALFGIGWGISDACPGPIAAQLGAGRVYALAVAAGVLVGVRLQPRLADALERAEQRGGSDPHRATSRRPVNEEARNGP
jgi:uncharacterized membrane protein YedE/YeeE